MASYSILKRLNNLMHLLKSYPDISKADLLDRLREDYDLDISERTLERDFGILKKDFNLDIIYDHTTKGYTTEETDQLTTFFKFAELSSLAELYEEGLKDYETFQKWVIPDDSERFKGLEHLKPILTGITSGLKLEFDKVNYYREAENHYIVTPIRIKEYLNRWYLIGVPDGIDEIRNFGIDRIKNLKITDELARKASLFEDQLKNYDDIVGVNFNDSENKKPEKIKMRVTNEQLNYFKSLPMHHSQVCVASDDNSGWGFVHFHLKPNYEFMTQLLRIGDKVEVLEPKWLRKKIKLQIDAMHSLYN